MAATPIPRARLDEVERRYLGGHAETDIARALAEEWGITRRQVRNYLLLVKAKLAQHAKAVDPDAERARVEALLLNAYRCAETGSEKFGSDARGMVAAAGRLGELYGVFAPRRFEVARTDLSKLTDEELLALDELTKKADGGDASG